MSEEEQEPEITIGTIVSPFGIKGEVKIRIETDFPERFESLTVVWLKSLSGEAKKVDIENVRFHQKMVLIKFEGYDDRNAAETLRGMELQILKSQLHKLNANQFYLHDIIGLDVYNIEGEYLGAISEIISGQANDVYVTSKVMIPALKEVVTNVDLVGRKMTVRSEKLMEFDT